jgi:hypothetical protein
MKSVPILAVVLSAMFVFLPSPADATAIVGMVDNGVVYLGGDSLSSEVHSGSVNVTKKVFRNGEFIIGVRGSRRMNQLLHFNFKPPVQKEGQSFEEFIVNDFMDAVRKCFKDGGFAGKNANGQEEGGEFLVGYRGRLFRVMPDYQFMENVDGYDAIGSGAEVAKGSLYSTVGLPPAARIQTALEAAEKFNISVRRPFFIINSLPR